MSSLMLVLIRRLHSEVIYIIIHTMLIVKYSEPYFKNSFLILLSIRSKLLLETFNPANIS